MVRRSVVGVIAALLMGAMSQLPAQAGCIVTCITIHPPHIDPPHISIPSVEVAPGISVTPGGVVPTASVKQANKVLDKAVKAATPAANAILNAGAANMKAGIAPVGALGKVIAGEDTLGGAAKDVVHAQGEKYASIGHAVSETNGAENNIKVIAAESIGGDIGKTVMTISTGPNRLSVEFAATSLIVGGAVLQGTPPGRILAAPLAAALRAAEKQFEPEAKPLPPTVLSYFRGKYPDPVLKEARYAIGGISLSAPDITNKVQKSLFSRDNAVTVGHITVFSTDPADSMHWWAHELQHQVQYKDWGFDEFAFRYITSCNAVEKGAEDQAQILVPVEPQPLSC